MSWIITGTEKYETDPYRSQVSLLLHGDGTNGSTTITDSSPTPKTVTAVGNAQISTAQSKFGGSSIAFDGSGDYLTVAKDLSLELGSGNFTIELWVNISAASNFGGLVNTGLMGTVNASTWTIEFNGNTNNLSFFVGSIGSGARIITTTTNAKTSTWIHVAVSRSGNTTRMFINGIQEGATYIASYTVAASANPIYVGSSFFAPSTNTITGYIDDLRITKGVARYTSNFTPPTAPFPDI